MGCLRGARAQPPEDTVDWRALKPQQTTTSSVKTPAAQPTTTQPQHGGESTTTLAASTQTTTTVYIKLNTTIPRSLSNSPGPRAGPKPWDKQLAPKPPRILIVPESFQYCENNTECVLVTDCCGIYGRQYAINKQYKTMWDTNLECHLKENRMCGSCAQGFCRLSYYKNTVCINNTCEKTYES